MEKLIGRKTEIDILKEALTSNEAELVAVYGRRRVGKTFLISQVYSRNLICEFSGVHNAPVHEQLDNFRNVIAKAMNSSIPPAIPKNWTEAGFKSWFLFIKVCLNPTEIY